MVYLMKGKALSKGTKRKRNIEESDDPSVMSSDNSVSLSKTSQDESDTVATNDSTNNIFKDNVSSEKTVMKLLRAHYLLMTNLMFTH